MIASAATANPLLRRAWLPWLNSQAGGLAPQFLSVLFQVRLGPSGLRAPVSQRGSTVSRRTTMNNAG